MSSGNLQDALSYMVEGTKIKPTEEFSDMFNTTAGQTLEYEGFPSSVLMTQKELQDYAKRGVRPLPEDIDYAYKRLADSYGGLEILGKGIANLALTTGTEIAKIPTYIPGILFGGYEAATGGSFWDGLTNNIFTGGLDNMKEYLNENQLKIHVAKEIENGNILQKLGSGAWWATSGADFAGFTLSMFAPGAFMKAINIGGKIAKIANTAKLAEGTMAARMSKILGASAVNSDIGKIMQIGKKSIQNLNSNSSIIANTVIEGIAEAGNSFDLAYQQALSNGATDYEAKQIAGDAAGLTFAGNLPILGISNFIFERMMLGKLQKTLNKTTLKKVLQAAKDGGVKDLKEIMRPLSIDVARQFGIGAVKEGYWEEGMQTLLQQNIMDTVIDGETESPINGITDFTSTLFGTFFDSATTLFKPNSEKGIMNNKEFQEAAVLGGLTGGLMEGVIGTVSERIQQNDLLFGRKRSTNKFINRVLNRYDKEQDSPGLAEIFKNRFDLIYKKAEDLAVKDADGKIKYVDTIDEQGNPSKRIVWDDAKLAKYSIEQREALKKIYENDLRMASGHKELENFGLDLSHYGYFMGTLMNVDGGYEVLKGLIENDEYMQAEESRYTANTHKTFTADEKIKIKNQLLSTLEKYHKNYTQATKEHTAFLYTESRNKEEKKWAEEFDKAAFSDKLSAMLSYQAANDQITAVEKELADVEAELNNLEVLDAAKESALKAKEAELKMLIDEANQLKIDAFASKDDATKVVPNKMLEEANERAIKKVQNELKELNNERSKESFKLMLAKEKKKLLENTLERDVDEKQTNEDGTKGKNTGNVIKAGLREFAKTQEKEILEWNNPDKIKEKWENFKKEYHKINKIVAIDAEQIKEKFEILKNNLLAEGYPPNDIAALWDIISNPDSPTKPKFTPFVIVKANAAGEKFTFVVLPEEEIDVISKDKDGNDVLTKKLMPMRLVRTQTNKAGVGQTFKIDFTQTTPIKWADKKEPYTAKESNDLSEIIQTDSFEFRGDINPLLFGTSANAQIFLFDPTTVAALNKNLDAKREGILEAAKAQLAAYSENEENVEFNIRRFQARIDELKLRVGETALKGHQNLRILGYLLHVFLNNKKTVGFERVKFKREIEDQLAQIDLSVFPPNIVLEIKELLNNFSSKTLAGINFKLAAKNLSILNTYLQYGITAKLKEYSNEINALENDIKALQLILDDLSNLKTEISAYIHELETKNIADLRNHLLLEVSKELYNHISNDERLSRVLKYFNTSVQNKIKEIVRRKNAGQELPSDFYLLYNILRTAGNNSGTPITEAQVSEIIHTLFYTKDLDDVEVLSEINKQLKDELKSLTNRVTALSNKLLNAHKVFGENKAAQLKIKTDEIMNYLVKIVTETINSYSALSKEEKEVLLEVALHAISTYQSAIQLHVENRINDVDSPIDIDELTLVLATAGIKNSPNLVNSVAEKIASVTPIKEDVAELDNIAEKIKESNEKIAALKDLLNDFKTNNSVYYDTRILREAYYVEKIERDLRTAIYGLAEEEEPDDEAPDPTVPPTPSGGGTAAGTPVVPPAVGEKDPDGDIIIDPNEALKPKKEDDEEKEKKKPGSKKKPAGKPNTEDDADPEESESEELEDDEEEDASMLPKDADKPPKQKKEKTETVTYLNKRSAYSIFHTTDIAEITYINVNDQYLPLIAGYNFEYNGTRQIISETINQDKDEELKAKAQKERDLYAALFRFQDYFDNVYKPDEFQNSIFTAMSYEVLEEKAEKNAALKKILNEYDKKLSHYPSAEQVAIKSTVTFLILTKAEKGSTNEIYVTHKSSTDINEGYIYSVMPDIKTVFPKDSQTGEYDVANFKINLDGALDYVFNKTFETETGRIVKVQSVRSGVSELDNLEIFKIKLIDANTDEVVDVLEEVKGGNQFANAVMKLAAKFMSLEAEKIKKDAENAAIKFLVSDIGTGFAIEGHTIETFEFVDENGVKKTINKQRPIYYNLVDEVPKVADTGAQAIDILNKNIIVIKGDESNKITNTEMLGYVQYRPAGRTSPIIIEPKTIGELPKELRDNLINTFLWSLVALQDQRSKTKVSFYAPITDITKINDIFKKLNDAHKDALGGMGIFYTEETPINLINLFLHFGKSRSGLTDKNQIYLINANGEIKLKFIQHVKGEKNAVTTIISLEDLVTTTENGSYIDLNILTNKYSEGSNEKKLQEKFIQLISYLESKRFNYNEKFSGNETITIPIKSANKGKIDMSVPNVEPLKIPYNYYFATKIFKTTANTKATGGRTMQQKIVYFSPSPITTVGTDTVPKTNVVGKKDSVVNTSVNVGEFELIDPTKIYFENFMGIDGNIIFSNNSKSAHIDIELVPFEGNYKFMVMHNEKVIHQNILGNLETSVLIAEYMETYGRNYFVPIHLRNKLFNTLLKTPFSGVDSRQGNQVTSTTDDSTPIKNEQSNNTTSKRDENSALPSMLTGGGTEEPPFLRLNYKIPQRKQKANVTNVTTNLQRIFGQNFSEVEFVKGLIAGEAVGQFTEDGRILLSSDNYVTGAEYHEAFHRVWRRFLTDAQRDELIQEFIAANPKIKEILDYKRSQGYGGSDASLIEETFAEEFRMFILMPEYYIKQNRSEKNKFERKKMNLFQRLLALIKGFLGIKETYFDAEYAALNVQLSDNILNLFQEIGAGKFSNSVQSSDIIHGAANMVFLTASDYVNKKGEITDANFNFNLDATQINQAIASVAGIVVNKLLPSIKSSFYNRESLEINSVFEEALKEFVTAMFFVRKDALEKAKVNKELTAEEIKNNALFCYRPETIKAEHLYNYMASYINSKDSRDKFEIDFFEEVKKEINAIAGLKVTFKNAAVITEDDKIENPAADEVITNENEIIEEADGVENSNEANSKIAQDNTAEQDNYENQRKKTDFTIQATIDPRTTINQKIKLLLYGIYNSSNQLRNIDHNTTGIFGLYNPKDFNRFLASLLEDLSSTPPELFETKLSALAKRKRKNYRIFLENINQFFFKDEEADDSLKALFIQSFSNFNYTYMITALNGKNIYPINENKNTTRELIRTKIKAEYLKKIAAAKDKRNLRAIFGIQIFDSADITDEVIDGLTVTSPKTRANLIKFFNSLNLYIPDMAVYNVADKDVVKLAKSIDGFTGHVLKNINDSADFENALKFLNYIFAVKDGGIKQGVSGRIDDIADVIEPMYERITNAVKGPDGKTYFSVSQYTYQTLIVSKLKAFDFYNDVELNEIIDNDITKEKLLFQVQLRGKNTKNPEEVNQVEVEIIEELKGLLEHFREYRGDTLYPKSSEAKDQFRIGKKLYLLYLYSPELLHSKTKFSSYFRKILFEEPFTFGVLNHLKNMENGTSIETAKLNNTEALVQTMVNELAGVHRVVQHADRSTTYIIETKHKTDLGGYNTNIFEYAYSKRLANKIIETIDGINSYSAPKGMTAIRKFIAAILPIMQQEFKTNALTSRTHVQGAGVNGYEKDGSVNQESVFDDFIANEPFGMFQGGIKATIANLDLQNVITAASKSVEKTIYDKVVNLMAANITDKIRQFKDVLLKYGVIDEVRNIEGEFAHFATAIKSEFFENRHESNKIEYEIIENVWLNKAMGHIEEMLLFFGDPRVYMDAVNAFKRFNLQSSTGKVDVTLMTSSEDLHITAAEIIGNEGLRDKINYGNKTPAKYDGSAREVIGTEEKRRSTSVDFVRETAEIHYKNILERENEANLFRYIETQVKRYIANELEDELKKLTKEFEKTNTFKDALDGEKATNKFFKLEIHGRTVRTKVLNEFKREKRGELIKKFRDNFIFTKRNGKIVSVKNTRTGEVKNVKWSNSDIEKKAVKHGAKQATHFENMVIDDGQSWLNIYSYTTFKDNQGAWEPGHQLTLEFELFVYADAIRAIDGEKANYTSMEILATNFIKIKELKKIVNGESVFITTDELLAKLEPFTPEKSKYIGNSYENRDEWMVAAIDTREAVISVRKHAYDVLIPSILRGGTPATRSKQFDKMRFMIDHGIDFYHTVSGAKSGVRKTHKWYEEVDVPIFDETTGKLIGTKKQLGNFNAKGLLKQQVNKPGEPMFEELDESYASYLDWQYVQEQLEIDSREKTEIIDSVQKRKNILGDLEVNGVPIDFYLSEEEEKNGNLFDIWNSLSEEEKLLRSSLYASKEQFLEHTNALMTILIRDLKLLLGYAETSDGKFKLANMQDMIDVIKEKAINKSSADNIISSIENLIDTGAIEALPNRYAIEPVLLSIISNALIKINRPGNAAVQVASLGLEAINTPLELHESGKYLANTSNAFYADTEEKNPNIRPSQVRMSVPLKWRKKFIDFANKMEENKNANHTLLTAIDFVNNYIAEKLAKGEDAIMLIGLRIPNQQLSSNNVFSVIKFYPPTKANYIYVNSEVVAKEGSDFDIDKLQLYFDTELLEQEDVEANDYKLWKAANKHRIEKVKLTKKSSLEIEVFTAIKPFSKHAYNKLMGEATIPAKMITTKTGGIKTVGAVELPKEISALQHKYKTEFEKLSGTLREIVKAASIKLNDTVIKEAVDKLLANMLNKNASREITVLIKEHHEVIRLLIEKKKNLGKSADKELLDKYISFQDTLKTNIITLENFLVTMFINTENSLILDFLTFSQALKMSEIEENMGAGFLDTLYAKILEDNQDIVSRISELKKEQQEIERENQLLLAEREKEFKALYEAEKIALNLEYISQEYHLHKLFEAEKNLILNKANAGQLLSAISIDTTNEVYNKLKVFKADVQQRNKLLPRIINPVENVLNNEIMNHAKFNVGIVAVNQSLQRILSQLNIPLRDAYAGNSYRDFEQRNLSTYVFIGDIGDSLSMASLVDENGNLISVVNSELVSLQVDNVKTLKSTLLNLKTETMTIAQYLIARGVGYEAVLDFLTSPILDEFLVARAANESMVSKGQVNNKGKFLNLKNKDFLAKFLQDRNLKIAENSPTLEFLNTESNTIKYDSIFNSEGEKKLKKIEALKKHIEGKNNPEAEKTESEKTESDYFKILYFLDLEIISAAYSVLGKAAMPDKQEPKNFVEVQEIQNAIKRIDAGNHLISKEDFARIKNESSQSMFYKSQREYENMFEDLRIAPRFAPFIDYMAKLYGKLAKASKISFKQKLIDDLIVFSAFFDMAVKKAILENLHERMINTGMAATDVDTKIRILEDELGEVNSAIYNFSFEEILNQFSLSIDNNNEMAKGLGILNSVLQLKNNGEVEMDIFALGNNTTFNINNLSLIGKANTGSSNSQLINGLERVYKNYLKSRQRILLNPEQSLIKKSINDSNYLNYLTEKYRNNSMVTVETLKTFQRTEEFLQKLLALSVYQTGISSSVYNLIRILPSDLSAPLVERGTTFLKNYLSNSLDPIYDTNIYTGVTIKDLMPSIFKLWFFMANPSFANSQNVAKARASKEEITPVILKFKPVKDDVFEKTKFKKILSFITPSGVLNNVNVVGDSNFKNFTVLNKLISLMVNPANETPEIGTAGYLLAPLLPKAKNLKNIFKGEQVKPENTDYTVLKSEDMHHPEHMEQHYFIFYEDKFKDKTEFNTKNNKRVKFSSIDNILFNKSSKEHKVKIGFTNPSAIGRKPSTGVLKLKNSVPNDSTSVFKVVKIIGNFYALLADTDANFEAFKENVENVLTTLKNVPYNKEILFPKTIATPITTIPVRFSEYLQERLKEELGITSEIIKKEGFYILETDFNEKFPMNMKNINEVKELYADRLEERSYLKILGVGEELIRDPKRFEVSENTVKATSIEASVLESTVEPTSIEQISDRETIVDSIIEPKEESEFTPEPAKNYTTVFEGDQKEQFIIRAISDADEYVSKTNGKVFISEEIHKILTLSMIKRAKNKKFADFVKQNLAKENKTKEIDALVNEKLKNSERTDCAGE